MKLLKPPMGWNSWNTFGRDINEDLIRQTADALVESGLAGMGYDYVVIDDCWSEMERDSNGRLVPDKNKFPSGMKALGDYIHSKGLKFGMYNCTGMLTCEGYPGGYEHEFTDAESYASWGVDFLKYDYGYRPVGMSGELLYKRMSTALANCGRDIVFSACSWGADNTKDWIASTGASLWRSTYDIFDCWEKIRSIALLQRDLLPYGGIDCFNDMDMLVVGMHGQGNVALGGCTDIEYQTHFSFWSLMSSPLMLGCDIRNMSEETKRIISNRDVIAINQDESTYRPYEIGQAQSWHGENQPLYVRMLSNGDFAIGMFNFSDEESPMCFTPERMGLPESCPKTLAVRDLWTGEEPRIVNNILRLYVPAHGCKLFRARVVDR